MLRLPTFELIEPKNIYGALSALADHGEDARIVAGGTDMLVNMKHKLFDPKVLVSLAKVRDMAGITQAPDGSIEIGSMARLCDVASSELLQTSAPALAQATSLIAGPQLREMGTLGGNVMLDTRCQWYNQTYFWRQSLGFCLKKDGTECHVVKGGGKCVAAASNDSAPALMSLGAVLVFERIGESREVPIADFWKADGIFNKRMEPDELLTRIRIPAQHPGQRGAYGKLRDRASIDFPLFGCAVRLDVAEDGIIEDAAISAVALVARPLLLKRVADELRGVNVDSPEFTDAVERVAALAYKQCRPMDNIPGEADYRHEMVPVYVRRTLLAAAQGTGPVHHI
ncbi:MAG: 4-hydroxybenzoyl-CoA reductase subunit beta [Planctomycetota bacterium]|jgi:4-hydroxybenzoyl-CoA reductase subunit beta